MPAGTDPTLTPETRRILDGQLFKRSAPGIEVLTDDEHEALDLLAEAGRLLRTICGTGPTADDDWNELAGHLHAVQRTVAAQAAARAYPARYRLLGEAFAHQDATEPPAWLERARQLHAQGDVLGAQRAILEGLDV